jgi:hypothetical protein
MHLIVEISYDSEALSRKYLQQRKFVHWKLTLVGNSKTIQTYTIECIQIVFFYQVYGSFALEKLVFISKMYNSKKFQLW